MAPPFIAYYGAVVGGDGGDALLAEAYQQCKLYRQYLRDDSGLWKHIVLGSFQDNNHWGTGTSPRPNMSLAVIHAELELTEMGRKRLGCRRHDARR